MSRPPGGCSSSTPLGSEIRPTGLHRDNRHRGTRRPDCRHPDNPRRGNHQWCCCPNPPQRGSSAVGRRSRRDSASRVRQASFLTGPAAVPVWFSRVEKVARGRVAATTASGAIGPGPAWASKRFGPTSDAAIRKAVKRKAMIDRVFKIVLYSQHDRRHIDVLGGDVASSTLVASPQRCRLAPRTPLVAADASQKPTTFDRIGPVQVGTDRPRRRWTLPWSYVCCRCHSE